jgi:tetratricopeptide (TPR) repeat protein
MTCTTCHNPHRPVGAAERAVYYRQKCLECHQVDSCGLPEATRIERQADDNCVTCHMPVTDTDIPHFAFTHHRVGIHASGSAALTEPAITAEVPPVVAADDETGLSPLDRQRNRGLALLTISEGTAPKPHRLAYHQEAIRLLEDVAAQGVHDPALDTALARILWQRDLPRTIRLASRALAADPRDPMLRRDAASVLAEAYLGSGKLAEARETLRFLVEVRRAADDWMKLGFCELRLGEPQEAIKALKQAIEIEPHRADLHGFLAQTYQQLGYREQAQHHARRAQMLAEVREQAARRAEPAD